MDMNGVKLERARHRNQTVIKLVFAYDAALVAELRRLLPDARWSKTMRCWWVPDTAESLQKVFTAAKHKAGITVPFKLHGLRHCYATHLIEAGVGIRYIQELLGHRHIKTTEIYTHVSSEAIGQIQSPFDTLDIGTKP